ncbi:phosphatase PAP2 family protein [Erythrobacter sp.]|jgi:membrane-associated phospholipid phosphatase|uniref:phosphatase PAP2 family protein n=1 Tax=Erythrobacter sp. TaxID=1042 RepID=UPI002ECA7F41|nr:phosphatase PAP2 family protein [Erythrobacter sp.]
MVDENDNLKECADEYGPLARIDILVAHEASELRDTPMVKAAGKFGELADQPPLISASIAVIFAGAATRHPRLLRTGVRMLASHVLATGIKTLIKNRIDRPRPNEAEKDGEHYIEQSDEDDGEKSSFPSGHTAGAAAVAQAVSREYTGAAPVAYASAGVASLAQVPQAKHYPSDVLAGGMIGFVSEALVAFAVDRLVHRRGPF